MNSTHLFVVLIAATLVLVVPGAALTAGADSGETEGRPETFTMETESIELHGEGKICAEKIGPDRNRVTITNATFDGTTIYVPKDGGEKRIHIDDTRVRDEVVLVTNGENDQLDLLAETGGCIQVSQDRRSVVEAYEMRSPELDTSGVTISVHGETPGGPPEPTGFDLPANLTSNDPGQSSPVSPPSPDDAVGNATDTVDDATNETAGAANDTVDNATRTVNGSVDEGTETVNDTTGTVNDTGATANDTVADGRETANRTQETVTDVSAGGSNTSDGTSTIDDTADETTSGTTDATTDATPSETTDTTTDGDALAVGSIETPWPRASTSD